MVVGNLLHSYDRDKYESMAKVVDAYNKAVSSVQYDAQCNEEGSSARLRSCLKRRVDWRKWLAGLGIVQPGAC